MLFPETQGHAKVEYMLSTMQDVPLSVGRIVDFGVGVHGDVVVTTWSRGKAHSSTFRQIGARAAAFAHALREEFSITGDERVGSLMYNCAEHLEVMFGVSAMGAVFTPLNKQLMNDQIAYIINHSEMQVIVADPRLKDQLEELLPATHSVQAIVFIGTETFEPSLAGIPVFSYESLLDGRETTFDWFEGDERAAAALCYSTGTTGTPKGVAYSHRSLFLMATGLRTTESLAVTPGESFLCCVPIYHVLSWGVPFAALMAGTPLVLPDSDVSTDTLAEMIAATHPRVAHGVPSLWNQLVVHYAENPPERMSLTEIYAGGAPVSPALIRAWEERYGVDVVHVWGMTETTTVGTVARPPSGASGEARMVYRSSQGKFVPSLEFRVVNDGEVVSKTDRNQGELQLRGNLVAASYYHSDAPGTESFRGKETDLHDGDENFTADGWLRTGDVGSVSSDGYLQVSDRARDVIRSGGEWVYSAQVENLIMDNPEVVECAVIGIPDEKWSERPLAVTVLQDGVEASAETAERFREALRKTLPNWMAPEYWAFVSDIDKTSVGKFDKVDLREDLASGALDVIKLPGPGERNTEEN